MFCLLSTLSVLAASRDGGRGFGGGRGSLGAVEGDVVKEDHSKPLGENAR